MMILVMKRNSLSRIRIIVNLKAQSFRRLMNQRKVLMLMMKKI